jgi:hypothetical protein
VQERTTSELLLYCYFTLSFYQRIAGSSRYGQCWAISGAENFPAPGFPVLARVPVFPSNSAFASLKQYDFCFCFVEAKNGSTKNKIKKTCPTRTLPETRRRPRRRSSPEPLCSTIVPLHAAPAVALAAPTIQLAALVVDLYSSDGGRLQLRRDAVAAPARRRYSSSEKSLQLRRERFAAPARNHSTHHASCTWKAAPPCSSSRAAMPRMHRRLWLVASSPHRRWETGCF